MEYSFYDFLKLLGSLALFLYGMKIMSEGLQKFAGDRLRKILTAMTTNRVTGVLTGVLITAVIQSSYCMDYICIGVQSRYCCYGTSVIGCWRTLIIFRKE